MNTKLTKIVLSAVLVAAVSGCHSYSDKYTLSPGQMELIKQNKAPLILVLNADGQLVAADENGKTLRRCKVGAIPPKDATKDNPLGEACQGLQKDYAVQSLTSLTLIRSKKNPECWTFYDAVLGFAQELCW